ncbi:MAG: RNA polymerase sigma factor [Lentimicrobium sp.]|nr:RNA polymerase sigma factor [Lentimicrobium sp.]
MTEADLIKGLIAKDEGAWKTLVDQYQILVYNVCYGFLQNSHDAQDLTQDIFIEVFNNAHKFRGDSKLSTWLYRISSNRSLNFIRNNKKWRFWKELSSFFVDDERGESQESEEPMDSDEKYELQERSRLLYDAISRLPENQRIAFTLHKIEDLPYTEIAEVMNVTLPAVESLMHRAKVNLRKTLTPVLK